MKTNYVTNLIWRSWVELIIGKFFGTHFDEVKPFLSLSYCALQEKVVHIFLEPNAVQSLLQEFGRVALDLTETIFDYINRLRVLAVKAYPNLAHEQRKPILVAALSRIVVVKASPPTSLQ